MNSSVQIQIPLPYFITSPSDEILFSNDVFHEYVLTSAENKKVYDIFETWEEFKKGQIIRTVVNGKSCVFLKTKMKETQHFFYIGTFSYDLLSLIDELKEAHRLNRELDAIIENSYDGIYITNKEGVTIKTNSAIERITGIPKEYYIGKKVDYLQKRGILQDSVTEKVLEKKRTVSLVQLNYLGRETLLTGNPIFNEKGDIEGVVTNIRDLSELNELQEALRKANELNETYKKEIDRLKRNRDNGHDVVVKSKKMKLIYDTATRIVNVDATVLILGETGVGKDVLARYIYHNSERRFKGKFVKVNCGAIPPELLESELFGYEGGAFTGASAKGKKGLFEMAEKGVLFLDEVGELPINLQVKLLRVIQEREIQRVGGTQTKKIDVRIIAATNRDLKEMVKRGQFREDLFYRLNVVPIHIPPLRDRKEDILPLVELFLQNVNKKYGKQKKMDPELKNFFYHYHWPGNIRELSNLIERIVLVNRDPLLKIHHLPTEYQNGKTGHTNIQTLKEAVEQAEKNILIAASKKCKTTYEMAEALQTSQPTIVRKLKKYNITMND
ncbi:sigma-54 interaction domain-containing protein [Aeribacillus alveayuensis]|uniref:HTH-type transcriptional regulatory protein TyrR n=1 Tax=Aeribacillus alveayuensis TaxID=279215 RepID=A0ABT9VME5_9BACI|nr:PAS domain S-box-containing protein [Bacillus alveayuensis]